MSNITPIVSINNTDLPALFYQEKSVVTFKMIDAVHQRPEGTARRNFRINKKRFTEGKHYYMLESASLDEFRSGYPDVFSDKLRGQVLLITESGYLKLTKSFTDDLAWDIQDLLVDNYFRVKTNTVPRQNYKKITPEQFQEVRTAIHSSCTGWLFNDETYQHVHNMIRATCNVHRAEDMPAEYFPVVMSAIKQIRQNNNDLLSFFHDFMDEYKKIYIEGGMPWTPSIKGKYRKKIQEQLPARPNWIEMKKELEALEETKQLE